MSDNTNVLTGPLVVKSGVWDVTIPDEGYISIKVYEKDGNLEPLGLDEEMLTRILFGCSPVDSISETEQINENGVKFLSIEVTDDIVVQINSEVVPTSSLSYALGDYIVEAVTVWAEKISA